jgi:hypothetical protein
METEEAPQGAPLAAETQQAAPPQPATFPILEDKDSITEEPMFSAKESASSSHGPSESGHGVPGKGAFTIWLPVKD